ncbi:Flp family type IVb pilin [Oryzobacter terrae]|uniref:Flp family type IVb pilin n=1 Tax=Oryzobacter terrae TaxID=1620385 RepID=UPI00366C68C0
MTTQLTRLALTARATLKGDRGATAVEYALMVSFIAIVIIVAVITLGSKLSSFFIDAATQI